MRSRIIIVVLGLSLGLGARFAVDYYRKAKGDPKTEPAASKVATPAPTSETKGK